MVISVQARRVLLALAVTSVACGAWPRVVSAGAPPSTPAPERLAAQLAAGPRATRLTCEGAPWATFGPVALRRPSGYERRRGPAARELRRSLRRFRVDGGLAQHQWYLLARSRSGVLFANGRAGALSTVTLYRRNGRWSFELSGRCEPRAERDHLAAVVVLLASPPDGSDVLHLLIADPSCSSGRGVRGRVLAPRVWLADDAVTLTIHVRPLTGIQTCQGVPPTPVDVQLPEPLGARQVLDGGPPVPVPAKR